jgi:hypothetical protein
MGQGYPCRKHPRRVTYPTNSRRVWPMSVILLRDVESWPHLPNSNVGSSWLRSVFHLLLEHLMHSRRRQRLGASPLSFLSLRVSANCRRITRRTRAWSRPRGWGNRKVRQHRRARLPRFLRQTNEAVITALPIPDTRRRLQPID